MTNLINISYNEADEPVVSGRELHEKLEVKTAYKDWFPRMCEYGFYEGKDFCSFLSESTGGRPSTDHAITLDMAKQLCMIQRTDIGRKCREYFIEVEKAWNSDEAVMGRALKIYDRRNKALTAENNRLIVDNTAKDERITELEAEKAQIAEELDLRKKQGVKYFILGSYYEQAMKPGTDITLTETAKEIGCGRNELIDLCLRKKYLYRSPSGRLLPYANRTAKGVFTIKEYKYKGGYTLEPMIYVTIAGRAKLNAECINAGLVRPTLPDADAPEWELAEVVR